MSTKPPRRGSPATIGSAPTSTPAPATVIVSPPGYGNGGRGPEPMPTNDRDESWPSEEPNLDDLDDGAGGDSPADQSPGDTGPSPGFTDDGSTAGAVFGLVAQALVLVGVAVHAWRTPGPANAAWFMTEADANQIGQPLSRIVARKIPVGPGAASDVADGVEVAMATATYVANGLSDEKPVRAAARASAAAPSSST